MMRDRPFGPVGIIDIGSNSVRFVAYAGSERVPASLFNEKVTAELGRGVALDGKLDDEAVARTLAALGRFRQLGRAIGLKKLHTVATAAVRDASNGRAFLRSVGELGLKPRLVSGAEEAELAGLGVISAIPRAHGIVADLGGGSLELIGVARGAAGDGVSLPLGVLRLEDNPSSEAIEQQVRDAIRGSRLRLAARDHGLYLVGGSFRAVALLDLALSEHPLPIIHQHKLTAERLRALREAVAVLATDEIKRRTRLSSNRIAALPAALAVLDALRGALGPRRIVVSAFGLREGILYKDLPESVRHQDPLLSAAVEVGERLGRFGDHGAALDQWIGPLFADDGLDHQRYRLAACLLGDIAWNAHPDYRAERAVDMAVHGNWVGIDAHGRALIGRALGSAFNGDGGSSDKFTVLLEPGEDGRAKAWGKAIRLAQRLSGGTEPLLRKSTIGFKGGKVVLTLPKRNRSLYAEAVERRLVQLGKALGREVDVAFS